MCKRLPLWAGGTCEPRDGEATRSREGAMERPLDGVGRLGLRLTMLTWACHSQSGPQFPQMKLLALISGLCSIVRRALAHLRGGVGRPSKWNPSSR